MRQVYTFDKVVHFLLVAGVILGAYWLIGRLSGVLLPFLISWLLAYLLHPVVNFFQYKCRLKHRGLSVSVTLLLFVGLFVGIFSVLVPMVSTEMGKLSDMVTHYTRSIQFDSLLPEAWNQAIIAELSNFDVQDLLHNKDFLAVVRKMAPQLWNILSNSLSAVMGLTVVLICLLYLIFLLLDFESLSTNWKNLIPYKYRETMQDVVSDVEHEMNRYFRGQALVAACVGVLFSIGLSIIGLPLAIVIGLFIGFLNLVPYLQVVGVIPCVLMGILHAQETGSELWIVGVEIIVVFVVVQAIQDLVLVPKIMGNISGMHPAIILLALSIWGSLLGIVGMIVAIPLTTLIISYYKRFLIREPEKEPSSIGPGDQKEEETQQDEVGKR